MKKSFYQLMLALGISFFFSGMAMAVPVQCFNGPTLADSGLTLANGLAIRASIGPTFTRNGVTISDSSGCNGNVLQVLAGNTALDPNNPTELFTRVTSNSPVVVDRYLWLDFDFVGGDSGDTLDPDNPDNIDDRLGFGLTGDIMYDVYGASETGYLFPRHDGRHTLIIDLVTAGRSIQPSFWCMNDEFNGGTSGCYFSNLQTGAAPPEQGSGNPQLTLRVPPPGGGDNITPPPGGTVPEPATLAMVFLGLIAMVFRRRRPAHAAC